MCWRSWRGHAIAIAAVAALVVVTALACGRPSTESGARGGSPSGTSRAAPASTTTPPAPGPLQAAATAAQAQLSGLAESTGGHCYGASSGEALARAVLLAAVDKLPYRILDAAGKEVAKDVVLKALIRGDTLVVET